MQEMAPRIRTIGIYATQQKYSVDFFGEEVIVTVTSDASIVGRWIDDVLLHKRSSSQPLVVGVAVHWSKKRYSKRSKKSHSAVDTLQLCVGRRCIVIQLSQCYSVSEDLRSFLGDPDHRFVGLWSDKYTRRLEQSKHRLMIGELLDLKKLAKDSRGRRLRVGSFEMIAKECLGYPGVSLDPEINMSDWGLYKLCDYQILHASTEVFVSFMVGVKFLVLEKDSRQEENHETKKLLHGGDGRRCVGFSSFLVSLLLSLILYQVSTWKV